MTGHPVHNIDRSQVFGLVVPAAALLGCTWHDHSHLFREGVQTDSNGMVRLEDLARNARSVADLIYPLWIAEFPKGVVDAFANRRYGLSYGKATLCFWLAECADGQSGKVRRWDKINLNCNPHDYGIKRVLECVHQHGVLGLTRASMAGRGSDFSESLDYNRQSLAKAEACWRDFNRPGVYIPVVCREELRNGWGAAEEAIKAFDPFLLAFQVAMVIWEDVPPENIYRWIEAYKMPYEIHFPRMGSLFSSLDKTWTHYPANHAQQTHRYLW